MKYNIHAPLSEVDIPAMALYGKLDQAIDPEANAALLKRINSDIKIMEIDSINHLMQKAKIGSPLEYLMLPESFSQEIIDLIAAWIKAL